MSTIQRHGLLKSSQLLVQQEYSLVLGDVMLPDSVFPMQTEGMFSQIQSTEYGITNYTEGEFTFTRGHKQYELSNHLGNVLVTIQDRKWGRHFGSAQCPFPSSPSQACPPQTNCDYYLSYVVTITDYHAFGSTITERSATFGGGYRFGFNTQEKEVELGDGITTAEFWMYDGKLGRRWNVDPKTEKGPGTSPFAFCFNSPYLFNDTKGSWPYPIHIRSFAPYDRFGGYFNGDNRGYSLALGITEGGSVTSRVQQAFIVNPTANEIPNNPKTWSDPSHHPWFGTKTGTPTGKITDKSQSIDKKGNSKVSFTAHFAGNLPLIPSADIDVHTKFTIIENETAGLLIITAIQVGDQYTAAETFIGDTKGNQLFIGVSPAVGFDDRQALGPYLKLPYDNKLPMMSNTFSITMDKNGVFTGVNKDNKKYTISEWNAEMQSQPTEKLQEKPYPPR